MAGRRKVGLEQPSGWVFNRMADVYDARPAYPTPLVDAVVELAGSTGARVVDIGAGVGHMALPLAARGLRVTAIEPAHAMLQRLQHHARERGVQVDALHATSEAMPVQSSAFELAVIADALHFLDAALTGREIERVLAPQAALAVVLSELGDTPFMRGIVQIMEESAPRRPRAVAPAIAQVFALAKVRLEPPRMFFDETPVDPDKLERILRSISFIGPAMNAERFAVFRRRVRALTSTPVWARKLTLHPGRRAR